MYADFWRHPEASGIGTAQAASPELPPKSPKSPKLSEPAEPVRCPAIGSLVALYGTVMWQTLEFLEPKQQTNHKQTITNPSNIKQQTRQEQKTPKDAEGPTFVAT